MKFNNLKKVLGICLCSVSIAGAFGVGSMAMTKEELVRVRDSIYHEGIYEARGVVNILISSYREPFKEVEANKFYDAMAGLFKFMYHYFKNGTIKSNLAKINSALRMCLIKSGNSQSDFFFLESEDIARCFLHCVLIEKLSCEDASRTVLKIIEEKDLDGIIRRSHNDLFSSILLSVNLLDRLNELVIENEKGKVEEASESRGSSCLNLDSSLVFIPGMSSLCSYEENSKHFMDKMADDCYKSNYKVDNDKCMDVEDSKIKIGVSPFKTNSKLGCKRSRPSSSDVDYSEFDSSSFLMDIDHGGDESKFIFNGSPVSMNHDNYESEFDLHVGLDGFGDDNDNGLCSRIQLDDVDINELGKVDLQTLSRGKRMSDMSRIKGLINEDLSCYINAGIMQLYFMDGFRDYILNSDSNDEKIKALQCLFRYISGDGSVEKKHVMKSKIILGHHGETGLADSFWESLGVFKGNEGTLTDGSRYRINIYLGEYLKPKCKLMLEAVKKVSGSSSLGTGEEYIGYSISRGDNVSNNSGSMNKGKNCYISTLDANLPVDFEYTTNEGINYRLSDIVVYNGYHYYLLHRDVETGEWYEIDDNKIRKLTQEEVERIARKLSYFRLYKKV